MACKIVIQKMVPNGFLNNCIVLIYFLTVVITGSLSAINETHHEDYGRPVFPFDVVKFTCEVPSDSGENFVYKNTCTWNFITDNETQTAVQVTEACITSTQTKGISSSIHIYEGYVQVPENAIAVYCDSAKNITRVNPQPLFVQNVELAEPAIQVAQRHKPTIVLKRFTNDYSSRFAVHDVTDRSVSISGQDVNKLELLCIHSKNVSWVNYSLQRSVLEKNIHERDNHWVQSKSYNIKKAWQIYLDHLRNAEDTNDLSLVIDDDILRNVRQVYSEPLRIRYITNATSRRYECVSEEDTSHVAVRISEPRTVGPDEIAMIESIIALLDKISQSDGKKKEPWSSLGVLLSMMLILFMYYTKKKLAQQAQSQSPTTPKPTEEEMEMRARLQTNQSQSEGTQTEGFVTVTL